MTSEQLWRANRDYMTHIHTEMQRAKDAGRSARARANEMDEDYYAEWLKQWEADNVRERATDPRD